jgi:hypothetical protein
MTTQSTTREKTFEAASGPWTNLSSTTCKQLDTAFKAAEPTMQALARLQLEWGQLALARSRAWAAVPSDLSRCRGPADIVTLQVNFWQEAQRAYAQGWQRVLAASRGLAVPGLDAAAAGEPPRRDVLAVPEPKDERKRQAA